MRRPFAPELRGPAIRRLFLARSRTRRASSSQQVDLPFMQTDWWSWQCLLPWGVAMWDLNWWEVEKVRRKEQTAGLLCAMLCDWVGLMSCWVDMSIGGFKISCWKLIENFESDLYMYSWRETPCQPLVVLVRNFLTVKPSELCSMLEYERKMTKYHTACMPACHHRLTQTPQKILHHIHLFAKRSCEVGFRSHRRMLLGGQFALADASAWR